MAWLGVFSTLTIGAAAAAQKPAPMPTHSIRGVVKSVNALSMVIVAGSGKGAREVTFAVGPSTERDGEVKVGATVSVRYRVEGHVLISTAVSARTEAARPARGTRR